MLKLAFGWFPCKCTWEFVVYHWMLVKKPLYPDCFVQCMTRGRGEENFFPNLGINFSILSGTSCLRFSQAQKVKLIPLSEKMVKRFLRNESLTENRALWLQVAGDCVGTCCRKLSDLLAFLCRIDGDCLECLLFWFGSVSGPLGCLPSPRWLFEEGLHNCPFDL